VRITEGRLRRIIRETLLHEIDIEEVGESCWAEGSTHELSTCTIGGDKFYLKFSDINMNYDGSDPSLLVLNEYLAYKIYKLFPGAKTPGRIEVVYDRANKKVAIATLAVPGKHDRPIPPKVLAKLLSAGVYVDIFMSHWDISNTANLVVSPEGDSVTRIDPAGTLAKRAQGRDKGGAFSDAPGELETMLPTSNSRITDIFVGADLRVAAESFLGVPWKDVLDTIEVTYQQVLTDLSERGMNSLAKEWSAYVNRVTPILANRQHIVAEHCKHILGS
jgi:hypothetical protein